MFKMSENMICDMKIQHYCVFTAPDLNFIMDSLQWWRNAAVTVICVCGEKFYDF